MSNHELFGKADDLGNDFEDSLRKFYFLCEGFVFTQSSLDGDEMRQALHSALTGQKMELDKIAARFRDLQDDINEALQISDQEEKGGV